VSRKVISDHAVVRWLERVCGHDLSKVRKEVEIVTGSPPRSDSVLLSHMEQYHRLDVAAIRREIATGDVVSLIGSGIRDVPVRNRRFRLKIKSGKVTTVIEIG
jgi:hypothetical protein